MLRRGVSDWTWGWGWAEYYLSQLGCICILGLGCKVIELMLTNQVLGWDLGLECCYISWLDLECVNDGWVELNVSGVSLDN